MPHLTNIAPAEVPTCTFIFCRSSLRHKPPGFSWPFVARIFRGAGEPISGEIGGVKASLLKEIHKVIVGQNQVIQLLLAAMFSRRHCLLVGVPGLAKTLMISMLARM